MCSPVLHLAAALRPVHATFARQRWQTRPAEGATGDPCASSTPRWQEPSRGQGQAERFCHHALRLIHLGSVLLLRRAAVHHRLVVRRLLEHVPLLLLGRRVASRRVGVVSGGRHRRASHATRR